MISVIVPIYNVKPYLRQCIDSIINQTYTDLEIILVDDGSTDGSGEIVDSYDDPRIKVFHTENRGLSAARNLGIDNSHGEYISFVDADDWIEPGLLQFSISHICNADIHCFCLNSIQNIMISGNEALFFLLNENISTTAWGKLFKRDCFQNIRFPAEKIYEDIAILYKVFQQSSFVLCDNIPGYHYRVRNNSLTHTHCKQNILDYWFVHRDRYYDCKNMFCEKINTKLLQSCAFAISRAWAWRNAIPELKMEDAIYFEMSSFAKKYFPSSFPLPFRIRIGILLSKHQNSISFFLAHILLLADHCVKRKRNHALDAS